MSASSSSLCCFGSMSGPFTRGANAGLPTMDPRNTTLTQSRSLNTYALKSRKVVPSSAWSPLQVKAGISWCGGSTPVHVRSEMAAFSLIFPDVHPGFVAAKTFDHGP